MAVVLGFLPSMPQKAQNLPPKLARPRDGPLAEATPKGRLRETLAVCYDTVAASLPAADGTTLPGRYGAAATARTLIFQQAQNSQ